LKRLYVQLIAFVALGVLGLPQRGQAQFYYGLQQEYGKNRVQFTDFDWVYYRYEAFDVYFYRGNEELAGQVSRMVHYELPQIERFLDAPLDERLQILVFNNLTDLKQSNVNSSSEEDYNQSGVTRLSGRRLFLYFDGSYQDLRSHLRTALGEVVLANLMYGNFTQSITNSALLNLPAWYTQGLVSYIGERWNPEVDNEVRNGFFSGKYKRINSLTQHDARYAGHSFWNFIAETYGDKVIKNIVYMAVVNRDIESGFQYILGRDLSQITKAWKSFYREKYNLEAIEAKYEELDEVLKARKNHKFVRMALSPNGRYLAYVDQRFSRYKIYLYDFKEDKRQRILTRGYRIAQNTDYSYPLLAWHPNNEILAFFTEEKGLIQLGFYNLEDEELQQKDFFRFNKIRSFEYSSDGKKFLLSATKNGQSDIFIYTILNTKIEQVTNDDYDDISPTFFNGDQRIAWSSNRPVDSLFPNQKIYRIPPTDYNLFATEARELGEDTLAIWQMTESPGVKEIQAQEYGTGFLSYLTNYEGTQNQHLIQIDSSIAYVDTTTHFSYNFKQYRTEVQPLNILDQAYAPKRNARYDLVLYDNRYRVYEQPYVSTQDLNLERINQRSSAPGPEPDAKPQKQEQAVTEESTPLYYPGVNPENFEVQISNYQFGSSRDSTAQPQSRPSPPEEGTQINPSLEQLLPQPQTVSQVPTVQPDEPPFEIPPKRNYFLSFYQDEFDVTFDNMFTNEQYQPFTGVVSGNLLNQGFNANFQVGVMDLMHDYRIVAGVRSAFQPLPGTSLSPNAEFIFAFGDYKDRWDKIYSYRRRSQVQFLSVIDYQRLISHVVEMKNIWPFNPVASIRGSIAYRLDEDITLSRDLTSVTVPTEYTDYAVARASYVYDNTRKIGLNLYAGLRYKVFTEYYRNLTKSNTGLHTLGLDARQYLIIHRNMIWANRLAAGTSFGPEKLIHIMGGVDNAFNIQNDPSTPIARENNYVFQTLITNMRGFFQNARNGNHFTVVNSELRWPIVSYFANRPIRNDFLNNLMVIGFADVGTAWNGPSPYSSENAINTREVPLGNQGRIILDSQKEPIIFGTGFGLRSRLFGYYLRADWAWGVEDGIVLPNLFYFSLGTDF